MPVPLQHNETQRAVARRAYETLEPYHVVAYFNPHLAPASKDAGLGRGALYVGARGGPLGPTPAGVVTSCFYNFSPAVIEPGWDAALGYGLAETMALREQTVDQTLRDALGDRADDPGLADVAAGLRRVAESLPHLGRPLAAAWAALSWPTQPHLALWHATAVLREWRGDGHIAVLVQTGLDPAEACVFHEANHPDPGVRKRGMGRTGAMRSRGWDEQAWGAAADRLAERGLLTRSANAETLTGDGAAFFNAVEEATDDTAVWPDAPDADDLLARARPYVKAVIDAGVLPGTRKR